MASEIDLREADRLEVTILVDNYTDLLLFQSKEVDTRPRISPPDAPLAEHGLSCLIKVSGGSEEHSLLMDAGISATCLFHNAGVLGVDFSKLESVVLSHGHFDHFGGLSDLLYSLDDGTPLFLHEAAFRPRRINIPGAEHPSELPVLEEAALKETGAKLHKIKGPSVVSSDLVMVTGEVARTTDFEKGFPWAEAKIDGNWTLDPFHDDQAVVVKVRGKGLVIIGGCSHAGIINTVRHSQKVTQTDRVHAVLGGFHLGGPIFEPIIGPTVEEMKKIGPDYIVPMHCTGWKAINHFAGEMPDPFILNSVGTTYVFQ